MPSHGHPAPRVSQTEVTAKRVFDGGQVIPVQIVHRVTVEVAGFNGADLVHQKAGAGTGYLDLGAEDGGLSAG